MEDLRKLLAVLEINNTKLTLEQIDVILNIKKITDLKFLYEFIGNLYLVPNIDSYINLVVNDNNKVTFNEILFPREAKEYFDECEHLRRNNSVLKGIPCKYCKSTNTKATFETLRSGDEGQILVNVCFSCDRK